MSDEPDWLEEFVKDFTKSGERKAKWLRAWADGAGWRGACAAAGVAESTPVGWEKADAVFAQARAMAERVMAERHEETLDGIASGASQGSQVQLNALALRLRGLKPGRYRDGVQKVEVSGGLRMEDGNASRALEMLERFAAAARLRAEQESPPALPEPGDG
jgi:hypothetical protein